MQSAHRSVESVLALVRDELTDVARQLQSLTPYEVGHAVPELDTRLRRAYEGTEACRRYVVLHRAPECRYYKPAEAIRAMKGTMTESPFTVDVQANRETYGDPDQVSEALKVLLRQVSLLDSGGVTVELMLATSQPKIVISTVNSVAMPEDYVIEGLLRISLRQIGRCWIGATHGGHIHQAADGLVLFLEGEVPVPDNFGDLSALQVPLDVAARKLGAWRGAIGQYEDGLVAPEDVIALYSKNVNAVLEQIGPAVDAARELEL